jgi:CPA1 family monovalent cation:H+ antiporter
MIILRIIQIFVVWLVIASLVSMAVKRFRLPYTVVLVLVGLALAIVAPVLRSHPQMVSPDTIRTLLIPNLILSLFIPPLVFEAAFQMEFKELKQDLGKVLAFTIPGVVITMLLVGFGIAWMPGLTIPVALLFGALISATDPVAVVALFRSLGAPKRLVLLLEGESLFNDVSPDAWSGERHKQYQSSTQFDRLHRGSNGWAFCRLGHRLADLLPHQKSEG